MDDNNRTPTRHTAHTQGETLRCGEGSTGTGPGYAVTLRALRGMGGNVMAVLLGHGSGGLAQPVASGVADDQGLVQRMKSHRGHAAWLGGSPLLHIRQGLNTQADLPGQAGQAPAGGLKGGNSFGPGRHGADSLASHNSLSTVSHNGKP
jgi:hypothetical protein